MPQYLEHYAADHCEWVEGAVIRVSPSHYKHMKLIYFLYQPLDTYFELNPVGKAINQPFILRLPVVPNRRREPDLLVILDTNPHELKGTYMGQAEDGDDHYQTPELPGLKLHVPTLWQADLPGPGATSAAVQAMLEA